MGIDATIIPSQANVDGVTLQNVGGVLSVLSISNAELGADAVEEANIKDGEVTSVKLNADIVGIDAATGKITALTSTNFSSLDGVNLTNTLNNINKTTGINFTFSSNHTVTYQLASYNGSNWSHDLYLTHVGTGTDNSYAAYPVWKYITLTFNCILNLNTTGALAIGLAVNGVITTSAVYCSNDGYSNVELHTVAAASNTTVAVTLVATNTFDTRQLKWQSGRVDYYAPSGSLQGTSTTNVPAVYLNLFFQERDAAGVIIAIRDITVTQT